jgi:uncharacterized protein
VLITPRELEIHRIVISKTYAPGKLDYHGAEFRQVIPLQVNAVAELVAEEIHIRGRLETRLEAVCDRCLGRVEIRVDHNLDLFYRPMSTIAREEEVEIPRDELEVGFYSGEGIELADVLSEQVILSVPMKLICGPDCQGLCPICGANRNVEDCHCPTPTVNSPFISLEE